MIVTPFVDHTAHGRRLSRRGRCCGRRSRCLVPTGFGMRVDGRVMLASQLARNGRHAGWQRQSAGYRLRLLYGGALCGSCGCGLSARSDRSGLIVLRAAVVRHSAVHGVRHGVWHEQGVDTRPLPLSLPRLLAPSLTCSLPPSLPSSRARSRPRAALLRHPVHGVRHGVRLERGVGTCVVHVVVGVSRRRFSCSMYLQSVFTRAHEPVSGGEGATVHWATHQHLRNLILLVPPPWISSVPCSAVPFCSR